MNARRKQEFNLIKKQHGAVEFDDSLSWLILKKWPLSKGWNKPSTEVLLLVPPGYPATPPDNFYADSDLRLANGGQPGNTTPNHQHQNKPWLQFSYHVEKADWQPHAEILQGHNLSTFLEGVTLRLGEVS